MNKMNPCSSICNPIILISALCLSCGTAGIGNKAARDNRLLAERWFDPLNGPADTMTIAGRYPGRGMELEVLDQPVDRPDSGSAAAIEPAGDPTVIFRVQIYASKSLDDAKGYVSVVENLFPEGIFIEYQAPYYKVRLGEFHDPKLGQAFLEKVKGMGFENAWLVRTTK